MVYLGGKSRIAKALSEIIAQHKRPVWDAFCGGGAMTKGLIKAGVPSVVMTDVDVPLISMWQAVQAGWDPPYVTKEMYYAAKQLPDTDPLKAFAGYGCSFSGKWFGGYAQSTKKDDYPAQTIRGLAKMRPLLDNVEIGCVSFLDVIPFNTEMILYLDPPYRNTTSYKMPFDHDRFDDRVRAWSKLTTVYVSEYDLPYGETVWEKRLNLRSSGAELANSNTEKLYRIG